MAIEASGPYTIGSKDDGQWTASFMSYFFNRNTVLRAMRTTAGKLTVNLEDDHDHMTIYLSDANLDGLIHALEVVRIDLAVANPPPTEARLIPDPLIARSIVNGLTY